MHRGISVAIAATLAGMGVALGSAQSRPPITFSDVTTRAGITFVHHNGAAGQKFYPELFGGSVAVLDIDGDRWPDLLFVNGKDWPASARDAPASARKTSSGEVSPKRPDGREGGNAGAGGQRARHGLYLNNRNGTFKDVVDASGFDNANVYGLGATVADYDNDGRDDVFMTTVDGGRLFHNEGGGKFADVTARAGLRNAGFAVSAAWLDYDRDGLVDLFIGNYVDWSPGAEVACSQDGVRGYCGPNAYKPVAPALYRNRGGGRFEDVTAQAGLDHATDKAMGVAVLDYNTDGWPDVFVGSDRVPAKLHRNDGKGHFVDVGVAAGVALSESGAARANMGVDAADYDRSGRPHLLVGNFVNEMLGLYHNRDGAQFVDVAPRSTVGRASLLSVTWAVFFFDYDLDGLLDIFAANGGTDESQGMDSRARLSQPPLVLRNQGKGTFEDITKTLGAAFTRPIMGRGAAHADVDGDGDLDIVLATLAGPAYLFRNDGGNQHNWLRVRVIGSRSNRSGLGATVRVSSASGVQTQTVRSGSSYASQSELALTFGLGRDASVASVDVQWPSGKMQSFTAVARNQMVVIDEERGLRLTVAAAMPPSPADRAPLR